MQIDYSRYYWQNHLVRLRPSAVEDWEHFYLNYFDNPARFLLDNEVELPLTPEGAMEKWRNFVESSPQNGFLNFAIETLDGTLVGSANLNSINERHGSFSGGMQIGREYRGKGYGTAALRILLDYAFNERRLHKYSSFVIEGNTASATMLQKLGAVQEGIVRETIYHQGRYWNEVHYGITAQEFNRHNK